QVVIKTTVSLALAWGLAAAMWRGSAAVRHRVWASALVAMLILPLIVVYGPEWSIQAPSWSATQTASLSFSSKVPLSTGRGSEPASSRKTALVISSRGRFAFVPIAWSLSPLVIVVWSVAAAFGFLRLFVILVKAARIAGQSLRITDAAWIQLA